MNLSRITNLSRNQIIILGVVAAIVLFFMLAFLGILPGSRVRDPEINFVVWGVHDDAIVLEELLKEYRKIMPNVSIEYRKFDSENYENALINALAAGEGPDIFMFHSSWLTKHGNKVVPAPSNKISSDRVKSLFPQVVEQDFVLENRIYALPLSVDTLALYYNRDILDRRGVALPPKTWTEFQQTVINRRVPAAFGGTSLIMQSTDILSLLFLQSGAKLPSQQDITAALANDAGLKALNFYTQFSAPNEQAIDAFAKQEIGLMLDYASAKSAIMAKSPFLNLDISEVPQFNLEIPVSVASYYGLTVAKKANMSSLKQDQAWDLIIYLTINEAAAETYLQLSRRPPALRSLIAKYLEHPEMGVFAKQALTARSFLKINQSSFDQIFDRLIKETKNRIVVPWEALRQTEEELSSILLLR